ncbi:MAG: DUF5689 domain-containing protein [Alistipes sp.]|nr:DUF5689 domain-containing protein [Alistipes sp.]
MTREGYFAATGPTWAVPVSQNNAVPQSAYRTFRDRYGNEISVYTSGYANFAGSAIPPGRLRLTGILSYNSSGYILTLRDLNDVQIEIDD